jgi:prevent-host-death family protein
MDISVTRFRAQCLEWIRQVESGGEVVEITRHGKPVARLTPPTGGISPSQRPWEKLRGSGVLAAIEAEDSALADLDFDALR